MDEDTNVYEQTIQALDDYFKVAANLTYERHLFRDLLQTEDKTVDHYVTCLHSREKYCEFADADDQIRDQLLHGLRDDDLRQKQLEETNITLGHALTNARQRGQSTQAKRMGAGIASAMNQLCELRAGEVHKLKARPEGNAGGRAWRDDRPRCYTCDDRPRCYTCDDRPRCYTCDDRPRCYTCDDRPRCYTCDDRPRCYTCDDRPRCYTCGRHSHFARNPQCPARGGTCTNSGKYGFAPVCVLTSARLELELILHLLALALFMSHKCLGMESRRDVCGMAMHTSAAVCSVYILDESFSKHALHVR